MPEPSILDIASEAVATIVVPGYVDFLAADGRAVWATNTDRVEKLQVDHGAPVATLEMPSPCGAMEVAFGSLWVASCSTRSIYRIDLDSNSVADVIATGLADPTGELSLAAGDGSIWVLSDAAGVLARIDPATDRVVAEIAVNPRSYAAAFGGGSVWVTNTGLPDTAEPGTVQRIDPGTNTVVATIPVGPAPCFIAADDAGVWTLNWGDGSASRVDVASNAATRVELGMTGGGGDIAIGKDRIWVRGADVLLAALDPDTSAVLERYGPPAGSGAVRVAGDLVWVTAHDINTVWVLRP